MMDKLNLIEEEVLKVPKLSGIYKIQVDFNFQRLHGETNLVYIGKAHNLRRRLLTFITGKGRNAINRFKNLEQAGFKLYFSYQPCDNPKILESEELNKFEKEHLELPPLNHAN
jgi:hypothetical protein